MSLQSSVNQALGSVAIAKNAISYAEMSKKMGERAEKEKQTLLENKVQNNNKITEARIAIMKQKGDAATEGIRLNAAAKADSTRAMGKAKAKATQTNMILDATAARNAAGNGGK